MMAKLARHDIAHWALTGGLAVEHHDPRAAARPVNDIDFVAADFAAIPSSLAGDFLFHHVHPNDPPGKLILQFVDPETALRVDVFRACAGTLRRAHDGVVSAADLVARLARLLLDLAEGFAVPAKHAADYLRLAEVMNAEEAEIAWRDHRKPSHPATYREASEIVRPLIRSRADLLIAPRYLPETARVCPRCVALDAFPLADPRAIFALLGYC
jgi:hypothetical protein